MYSSRILFISCYFYSSLIYITLSLRVVYFTYSIFLLFWPPNGFRELFAIDLDLIG